MTQPKPLIIVGGGLAGGLAAYALARMRPDVPFLLVEQGPRLGGNHIWSFFDSDLDADARDFIQPFVTKSWPDHEVLFPERKRRLRIGYNSIRSADFHRRTADTLISGSYRLDAPIRHVAPDHVITADGERIDGIAVVDARGPDQVLNLALGWQKFVGRTYRFPSHHQIARPIIMDATVEQRDGYRFIYKLPFSTTELMIEDTYYSISPHLDRGPLGDDLDLLAGPEGKLVAEESGVLPVLIAGELDSLWPANGEPVARIGVAGGFFHPTTGYSLPDAVENALLLTQQRDFDAAALHGVFRARSAKLWNKRSFFQLLNRMLFSAAEPGERYRVLQHFYRLPEAVIARFYAADLNMIDKMRILSGRPPVPLRRALAAMRVGS